MMKQVKFTLPLRMLAFICGLILSASAFAQQITVNGQVKDATGEPIIGATVRVEGQGGGVVTDFDGNFTINANQGATLSISYIGFETAQVTAAPNLVVTLQDDAVQSLNEVVVIGYGVVKKSDLTGSVTALKPDSKNKGVVVSAQDMLGGKVAGVAVTNTGGEAGAGAQIRIRGGSSLNASNDPLIVIDGVPVDNAGARGLSNFLATINPQDIESFNVLKDASATAIYGSRGSNGVIIITTKKGRKGQKPTVSYAGSFTISNKQKTLDVMSGDQFRDFVIKNFGADSEAAARLGTANTDWQDLIYRTAFSHDHNVTVSGSVGEVLPYRVSVGYTDQEGILKTNDFQRVTGSLNLNPSFFQDHLVLNLNAKGVYAKTNRANTGAISAAFDMDPTQDPYSFTSAYHKTLLGDNMQRTLNNFGGFFQWPQAATYDDAYPYIFNAQSIGNPLALIYGNSDISHSREFVGSADIDYKLHGFEDLRLHATLGADISQGTQTYHNQPWYTGSWYTGYDGYSRQLKRNLSLSTYAQYYHDFEDKAKNHFDLMVGYEWQHFWYKDKSDGYGVYPAIVTDENGNYVSGYKVLDADGNPLAGTQTPHTLYIGPSENYLVSFFGRANYSLLDRYYLTFTMRRDGTSRFGNHWATFPSAAFAWRVKDEGFLRNADWLSDLKLRLGWGKTGQQDVGDGYGWIPTYEMSTTNLHGLYPILDVDNNGVIDQTDIDGGKTMRPGNYTPELKWETTTTYNVGLDWGLFNQRLSGSFDWYYRKTTDLLNYATTVAMTANRNMANQNIGSLTNTGFEAAISWKVINKKDWYWTLDYNLTYNKNKITELPDVTKDQPKENGSYSVGIGNYIEYHQIGHPANSFYVYQQVYDQDGHAVEGLVVDRNGDGIISPADKYFYKHPAAPVTMGLSSRLEYKNWDLGVNFRASIGNYVFNNIEAGRANVSEAAIYTTQNGGSLRNRPVASLAEMWQSYDLTSQLNDRFVHNASFLKCDNITLGYSFANLFKTGNYNGLGGRIYGTVSNVFTITKYDGMDPEIAGGFDNELYPRPISFIIGLNLNF